MSKDKSHKEKRKHHESPAQPPAEQATEQAAEQPAASALTLCVDVGGTGIKAAVVDAQGELVGERLRVETPRPCPPEVLVETIAALVAPLTGYERVSVGFPGVVQDGVIATAPNLGTQDLRGFDLAAGLAAKLGKPARVANDADVQGLAVIEGVGVEMVVTLGTGFGTGLYHNGKLAPHLEISQIPFRKGETYDQQLGDAALQRIGRKKWLKRVFQALDHMRTLVNFRRLYIGGGNARHLKDLDLPENFVLVDNTAGILGGVRLWEA
jgi:polyphosphate glucokinase